MAKFLTTTGVSYNLEEIIKSAEDRLYIISPYLKINERMKELLEDKARMKIDVRVVYGKNELQPSEIKWLENLPSIHTSFSKNLHAKCYLNERQAILTSMNLYEFSQQHNDEMGILISQDEEPELYEEIRKEAQRLLRNSEEVRISVARVESEEDQTPSPQPRKETRSAPASAQAPTKGFCIRCKAEIAADPTKPYCPTHFTSWNRYKNSSYEEKHCHLCGKEHASSMSKPVCISCYRKYRNVFNFVAA